MEHLVVVSNRVATPSAATAEAGGLAVALGSVLSKRGGVWLGWSGRVGASKSAVRGEIVPCEPFRRATFDMTEGEHAGYYLGFANQVLWPALHGRADLIRYDARDRVTYAAVNERFARHVLPHLGPDTIVWVHDYHLMLLGQALRARGVSAPLGFFLHTPFPAADAMAAVPGHSEIVQALLAYDLIGFQSPNDLANFSDYIARHLAGTITPGGTVRAAGHVAKAGVFPIGIDAPAFRALGALTEVRGLARRLSTCFAGRLGVVGADRLDYTKGLPLRLRAFERLIERYPNYRRRAVMMQVAAPSREAVRDYADLKLELDRLAGDINGRHGDVDWTPVHYVNRTLTHRQLAALFLMARVGMVTPVRDGMNLVAKEYVAAQNPHDPGVLVLSCFAGAAEELESALIVNPHDVDGMADALRCAFEMPLDERRDRWSQAMGTIESNDVHAWCQRFLASLAAAGTKTDGQGSLFGAERWRAASERIVAA